MSDFNDLYSGEEPVQWKHGSEFDYYKKKGWVMMTGADAQELDAEEETAEILADEYAMAAIAEAEAECATFLAADDATPHVPAETWREAYAAVDAQFPFPDWMRSAIANISEMNERKRADYASAEDIFSNFKEAGAEAGVSAQTVVNVLMGVKNARIRQLEASGRAPENEALIDSYLDRAVYGVIGYAMKLEEEAGA